MVSSLRFGVVFAASWRRSLARLGLSCSRLVRADAVCLIGVWLVVLRCQSSFDSWCAASASFPSLIRHLIFPSLDRLGEYWVFFQTAC